MIEILGTQVIYETEAVLRKRVWLRGAHPRIGVITWGYTGLETILEVFQIKALKTFTVLGSDGSIPGPDE